MGMLRDGVAADAALRHPHPRRHRSHQDHHRGHRAHRRRAAGDDSEIINALEAYLRRPAAGRGSGAGCRRPRPEPPVAAAAPAERCRGARAPTPLSLEDAPAKKAKAPRRPTKRRRGSRAEVRSQSNQETIRVSVDTIERMMQLVSELVLTRNQLLELARHREDDALKTPLQHLSTLTSDLQDAVMRARMQPVGRLYANLPRLVRELSTSLGKNIDLVTEGADTELDRQLIEVIRDPLTHLIRNCADHGIETTRGARSPRASPRCGEIRVSAAHEAGQITIDIADDGKGLDIERIKQKIISQGLATEQDAQGHERRRDQPLHLRAGLLDGGRRLQRLRPRRRHGRRPLQHRRHRRLGLAVVDARARAAASRSGSR